MNRSNRKNRIERPTQAQINNLMEAKEFLENEIVLRPGKITDLFERILTVNSDISSIKRLHKNVKYPVILDETAVQQPHFIRKHHGLIHFLGPSVNSYKLLHENHSSHQIFWDIYQKILEQYFHYVHGLPANQVPNQVATSINRLRYRLAKLIHLDISEMNSLVSHSKKGDHFFGGSAASIFGHKVSESSSQLMRFEVTPEFQKKTEKAHHWNGKPCVKDVTSYYCTLPSKWECKAGIKSIGTQKELLDIIFDQVSNEPNFAKPNQMLHKVFPINIKGKEHAVVMTTSITNPGKKHDLLCFEI